MGLNGFSKSVGFQANPVPQAMRVSLYSIVNLNDRSSLLGPAVTYSLAENLELAASAYFFRGSDRSEYGLLQHTYFAFLQFYF